MPEQILLSGGVPPEAVSIDFETADTVAHSACAIGMARVEGGKVTASFYRLIRPPQRRIRFTDVHGLTWSMLKDQPTFMELWPEIRAFMGNAAWLVAHNAPFDRKVLEGSCKALNLSLPPIPFACTLKGARKALKALPSRSLNAVCQHLDIQLDHHHAESDALAAARIFLHLKALGLSPGDMLSPS